MSEAESRKTYCRRLGHEVALDYCRTESGDRPCRLILDCWWQQFDIRRFLHENFSEEIVRGLEKSSPPNKVTSLVDLIAQAQKRNRDSEPDRD